jgi:hypothetical protein
LADTKSPLFYSMLLVLANFIVTYTMPLLVKEGYILRVE